MQIGAQNGVSYIVTMQLSTKLKHPDGSSANFETGTKAVMVPALGEARYSLTNALQTQCLPFFFFFYFF